MKAKAMHSNTTKVTEKCRFKGNENTCNYDLSFKSIICDKSALHKIIQSNFMFYLVFYQTLC